MKMGKSFVILAPKYAVFRYKILNSVGASISVFDIAGRKLYGRELDSESGYISWGYNSAAGIYFCVLQAGNRKLAKKFFKL